MQPRDKNKTTVSFTNLFADEDFYKKKLHTKNEIQKFLNLSKLLDMGNEDGGIHKDINPRYIFHDQDIMNQNVDKN
jgi:hypothetical protein